MKRVTILQVSDLHWCISERTESSEISSLQTTINGLLAGIRSGEHLKGMVGDQNILILNGDMVGRGDWGTSVQQTFRKMLLEPLLAKSDIGLKWNYVISVPGNHDASSKTNLLQTERLRDYAAAADNVQRTLLKQHGGIMVTPFSQDPFCTCLDNRVYIRTFNSSSLCGAPNVELQKRLIEWQTTSSLLDKAKATSPANAAIHAEIDVELSRLKAEMDGAKKLLSKPMSPAVILPEEMDACQTELKNLKPELRIAVLHHNTLNFPGDDVDPLRFFNQTSLTPG